MGYLKKGTSAVFSFLKTLPSRFVLDKGVHLDIEYGMTVSKLADPYKCGKANVTSPVSLAIECESKRSTEVYEVKDQRL